ncbi:MAG: hypothetical protein P8J61_01365 [Gammaproteobacteria bacterium]|jgi:hypothetical protein|nr:hypothetical protein [Gammaproteobacteria bacterium]
MKKEIIGNTNVASEPAEKIERRSLVKAMGAATIAGLAVNASKANAQADNSNRFMPMRHSEDAWLDELSGSHRVFIDTSFPLGGSDGLLYSANLMNAHAQAYNGSDSDFAMVLCYRHISTPLAYNHNMWEKYGEIFNGIMNYPDPQTGEAPKLNILNSDEHAMFPGLTLDAMSARGVKIVICANATGFFAGQVAASTDQDSDVVFDELVANAMPGSRFVAAGVIATTRAQEYGYSLLYAG